MDLEILSQYLNFTTKFIIWTPDQLEFTLIFVTLNILSKSSCSAFIVTFYYFIKTTVIMRSQVLVH